MFPLNWDFPFRKKNGEMTTLLDSVAGGLTVSDIANNLTTTTDGKVLDARQGKALNDSKLNKSDIANNLTTTTEGKALDARQGKSLSDAITTLATNITNALSGKVSTDDIANNLNVTTGGKVLDARQGKEINDILSYKATFKQYVVSDGETKTIAFDSSCAYIMGINGNSSQQLGFVCGVGYGATSSRHKMNVLQSVTNVTVTQDSESFGVIIENSAGRNVGITILFIPV